MRGDATVSLTRPAPQATLSREGKGALTIGVSPKLIQMSQIHIDPPHRPEFSTRVALSEDAPAVARLLAQLGYTASDALIAGKLRLFAASECDEAFVAIASGRVVGCIGLHAHELFHAAGRLGRITALVVDKASRGSGAGRALIEAADSWFRSRGCIRAEVTSGDERADAHRFYVANGYQADERRFVKRF